MQGFLFHSQGGLVSQSMSQDCFLLLALMFLSIEKMCKGCTSEYQRIGLYPAIDPG